MSRQNTQTYKDVWYHIFLNNLRNRWGLKNEYGFDNNLIQGDGYRHCWPVFGVPLSQNGKNKFNLQKGHQNVNLYFIAAPNSNFQPGRKMKNGNINSMLRTFNNLTYKNYINHQQGVKDGLIAAINCSVKSGDDCIVVPMVGCGVYAGPHKQKIINDFVNILCEIHVPEGFQIIIASMGRNLTVPRGTAIQSVDSDCATKACALRKAGYKVGVIVAGNSGRPGGATCSLKEVISEKIKFGHKTQEEDIISNWFLTASYISGFHRSRNNNSNGKNCRVTGCNSCKPGHAHHCKNCGNKDSTHFSRKCRYKK